MVNKYKRKIWLNWESDQTKCFSVILNINSTSSLLSFFLCNLTGPFTFATKQFQAFVYLHPGLFLCFLFFQDFVCMVACYPCTCYLKQNIYFYVVKNNVIFSRVIPYQIVGISEKVSLQCLYILEYSCQKDRCLL